MMKTLRPLALITAAALFAAGAANAQTTSSADEEIKVLGFLEPIRNIHLTTSEAGRISDIYLKKGEPVTKDQPILKLDTKAHESGLEIAKLQSSSNASVDAATAEKDLTQIKLDALLAISSSARSKSETLRARANLQIAEAKLQSAQEEKAMAAHQVTKIEAEIERRYIRSPVTGVVVDIKKDISEFLSPSEESVVQVVQLDKLRLVVYVAEKYARALSEGMSLPVQVVGDENQIVGVIDYLRPDIDPASGLRRAELIIENPELKIRSGAQAYVVVARVPAS